MRLYEVVVSSELFPGPVDAAVLAGCICTHPAAAAVCWQDSWHSRMRMFSADELTIAIWSDAIELKTEKMSWLPICFELMGCRQKPPGLKLWQGKAHQSTAHVY
jgi:hypothetical protein